MKTKQYFILLWFVFSICFSSHALADDMEVLVTDDGLLKRIQKKDGYEYQISFNKWRIDLSELEKSPKKNELSTSFFENKGIENSFVIAGSKKPIWEPKGGLYGFDKNDGKETIFFTENSKLIQQRQFLGYNGNAKWLVDYKNGTLGSEFDGKMEFVLARQGREYEIVFGGKDGLPEVKSTTTTSVQALTETALKGNLRVGKEGIKVGGKVEGFIGGKVSAKENLAAKWMGIKLMLEGELEGLAGAGGSGEFDANVSLSKIGISAKLAAALGLGAGAKTKFLVDISEFPEAFSQNYYTYTMQGFSLLNHMYYLNNRQDQLIIEKAKEGATRAEIEQLILSLREERQRLRKGADKLLSEFGDENYWRYRIRFPMLNQFLDGVKDFRYSAVNEYLEDEFVQYHWRLYEENKVSSNDSNTITQNTKPENMPSIIEESNGIQLIQKQSPENLANGTVLKIKPNPIKLLPGKSLTPGSEINDLEILDIEMMDSPEYQKTPTFNQMEIKPTEKFKIPW